jgi:hypothetical protein
MASNKKSPSAAGPTDAPPTDLLRTFLQGFEEVTDAYGRSIQARVAEGPTRALAEHFTQVLATQANRLTAYVLQSYDDAGPAKRSEVDQLLTRQAAVELTRGVASIASAATSAPALKGIGDIIQLIKKIIKFILKLFGNVPPWLNDLLELIDEIVGSLGGLFGFRLQRDINQTEIDYLKSMYHLAKLNAIEQGGSAFDENDDQ